jgi:hypothetical protein
MSLTAEQIQIRLGKFNASTVDALMKPKGLGVGGHTYIREKIAERETGLIKEMPVSKSMQWGIDYEEEAVSRIAAALKLNLLKNETSLKNADYNLTGTPDVIINVVDGNGIHLDTGIEIKCPNTDTHIEFGLMSSGVELKNVEPKYYWQILSYMFLTGYDSWIFASYDPRMLTPRKQLYVFTINRNETDIELLKCRLTEAKEILNEKQGGL